MACQNSQISCRNSDETSFILTHFGEYLTTMTFEIDFLEGTIARREIKFSVSEIFENEVSNVAINSVGVVAVIGGNKMLCTEFKSDDNEYTETWFDFDELSDLPQLNNYLQIHLYSVGNIFKCFILDETYKCYNINFSYKSENNRFTLLNAKKIPSFNPYKSREILITNEYFFVTDDSSNEMVTFVSRILSLSEAAYLTLQKHEKMSLMKLKKRMGFPKCLPITRAPK
uniref:Uncharacterized protein n=1 Tax=Panagrolaimus superbus TaxID=310955 RepID=A0A914Y2A2_9BILA